MESLGSWVRRNKLEILLVVPMAAYVFGFTLYPVLKAIALGFTAEGGGFTLEHYRYITTHGQFRAALFNTIAITVIGLTLEMMVGLALAWILTREFRARGVFRSIMMVPMGVPTVVAGVTMLYIFSTQGYLNSFLSTLGLIQTPVDWAAGGLRTIMMVVTADMWKVTPMVVLILLAGLEAIPEEVYEAAAVDGATGWQTFWRVTIPLLMPSITTAVVIRGIDAFRIFEVPLVLAGRQTPVLATYVFDEYNQYHNNFTAGAAATILMVMIMIFAVGYLRATKEADVT